VSQNQVTTPTKTKENRKKLAANPPSSKTKTEADLVEESKQMSPLPKLVKRNIFPANGATDDALNDLPGLDGILSQPIQFRRFA